jgi:hypothetical protein
MKYTGKYFGAERFLSCNYIQRHQRQPRKSDAGGVGIYGF